MKAGNTTNLEHLKEITWNYRNNMSCAVLVKRSGNEPNDSEYYVYDSSGMRVKKITEHYIMIGGIFKFLDVEEKVYLDGYEIKRNKRINLRNSSSFKILERFSCHIMDDKETHCNCS